MVPLSGQRNVEIIKCLHSFLYSLCPQFRLAHRLTINFSGELSDCIVTINNVHAGFHTEGGRPGIPSPPNKVSPPEILRKYDVM